MFKWKHIYVCVYVYAVHTHIYIISNICTYTNHTHFGYVKRVITAGDAIGRRWRTPQNAHVF